MYSNISRPISHPSPAIARPQEVRTLLIRGTLALLLPIHNQCVFSPFGLLTIYILRLSGTPLLTRAVYSVRRGRLRSGLGPVKVLVRGLTATTPTAAFLTLFRLATSFIQREWAVQDRSHGHDARGEELQPSTRPVYPVGGLNVGGRVLLPRTAPMILMSGPRKELPFQRRSFSLPCDARARSTRPRGLHPPWDIYACSRRRDID